MSKTLFYKACCLFFINVFFNNTKAQIVKHSYRFYNNLSVSAPECGPDLVAAKAAGFCGAGATGGSFISDTLPFCGLKRTLYHNNLQWGLSYPNPGGAISNTYTIQMYIKTTHGALHNG